MIFNFVQKYLAVSFKFINTFFIVAILDLGYLGEYAFVMACSNLLSILCGFGMRSTYLRDFVKDEDHVGKLKRFVIFSEIFPKFTSGVVVIICSVAILLSSPLNSTFAAIVALAVFESSANLTSQKFRAQGCNTLSQFILNVRPLMLFIVLVIGYLFYFEVLGLKFLSFILSAYFISSAASYFLWFVLYLRKYFCVLDRSDFKRRTRAQITQAPELMVLAVGSKAQTRLDVICLNFLLDEVAVGLYRVATQVIAAPTAALYPIQSAFVRKLGRSIENGDEVESQSILRKARAIAIPVYLAILFVVVAALYIIPILEVEKYGLSFIGVLFILALAGLVKTLIPMIDSHLVFKGKTRAGAILQLKVIVALGAAQLLLIPPFGLPGAAFAGLLATIFWRTGARTMLKG